MERVSYAHVKSSQTPNTKEGDRKEQRKKTRCWQRHIRYMANQAIKPFLYYQILIVSKPNMILHLVSLQMLCLWTGPEKKKHEFGSSAQLCLYRSSFWWTEQVSPSNRFPLTKTGHTCHIFAMYHKKKLYITVSKNLSGISAHSSIFNKLFIIDKDEQAPIRCLENEKALWHISIS